MHVFGSFYHNSLIDADMAAMLIEKLDKGWPRVNLECLTPKAQTHLKHLQYLDLLDDLHNKSDPEPNEVWKLVAILDHMLCKLKRDDVHVKVKVLWPNQKKTWVRMDALQIDKPILLMEYAWKNKLQSLPHWAWMLDYATSEDEAVAIAQAFQVSSRMDKCYKFGIKVPQSVKDALHLDM